MGHMPSPFDPIFDDAARFEAAAEGFGTRGLVLVCAFHTALVGFSALFGWYFPATVAEHGGAYLLPAVLLAVQPPLLIASARAFRAQKRERFTGLNAVLTLVNCTWLGSLAWAAPAVLSSIFFAIFFAWAYHDAWLTCGRGIRGLYLLAFPALDVLLLLGDAIGERGLAWSWVHEGTQFYEIMALQVLVAGMTQLAIGAVGAMSQTQHTLLAESTRLAQEVALMRREREVVQASCNLLSAGLVASKFSHDVASPTSVLSLDARELRRRIELLPTNTEQAHLLEIADELDEIARRITEMAGGLARSIRGEDPLGAVDVVRLLGEAESQTRLALRGHGRAAVAVNCALAPADVWASEGHAGTLSNLLTNGALHTQEGTSIEVVGSVLSPWFYLIEIRDHGVSPAERVTTLNRIRELLALNGGANTRPGAEYRGFGVGLLLAKLHLLRGNGWVDVSLPVFGAGMVLQVLLPRVDPSTIPEQENRPEEALRAARPAISARSATLPPRTTP